MSYKIKYTLVNKIPFTETLNKLVGLGSDELSSKALEVKKVVDSAILKGNGEYIEICKRYCKVNDKGELVHPELEGKENVTAVIVEEENKDAFMEAISSFMESEVEVPVEKFSKDEVSEVLNDEQIALLGETVE